MFIEPCSHLSMARMVHAQLWVGMLQHPEISWVFTFILIWFWYFFPILFSLDKHRNVFFFLFLLLFFFPATYYLSNKQTDNQPNKSISQMMI